MSRRGRIPVSVESGWPVAGLRRTLVTTFVCFKCFIAQLAPSMPEGRGGTDL